MNNSNNDRLQNLFDTQDKHNKRFVNQERFDNDINYRTEIIKDRLLCIYEQTNQLSRCFNWKVHVLERDENIKKAFMEIIDIQKYIMSIFQLLGGDSEEYYKEFLERSKNLDIEWNNKNLNLGKNTNVLVVDIDEIVCKFLEPFEKFLLYNLHRDFGDKGLVKDSKTYSLSDRYGLQTDYIDNVQREFILQGSFASVPPYLEYINLLNKLKKLYPDLIIVFVSARPASIYGNIRQDTITWLNNYKVNYDLVLFDKDKSEMIKKLFPANIIGFIEDRDKHALEVSHLKIKTYLVDKPYNSLLPDSEYIQRVYSADDIFINLKFKLEDKK